MNRESKLSVSRQCELLSLARSTFYRVLKEVSQGDLALMEWIDLCHLEHPYYGSRRIRDWLEDRGLKVNRKRVRRFMRIMAIEARYPKKRLSQPGKGHQIYPYLLRDLAIEYPNQAWATDITYIPMAKGFVYLVAIIDLYSRRVMAWKLSNTMDASFCIDALEDAIENYGAPEIFNTDQGSQFTSDAFTAVLKKHGIRISMDGKGRWVDNVFIERLWRSVKYEDVYLKAYEGMGHARESIKTYFEFYNKERRHYGLERATPDQVYFGNQQQMAA